MKRRLVQIAIGAMLLLAAAFGALVPGRDPGGSLPGGIVSGNGRFEAREISIASMHGGRVREILAAEGDLVDAGAALARVDTEELEAELDGALAAAALEREVMHESHALVAQRESELRLARHELSWAESLARDGHVPQSTFDARQTALDVAEAALNAANAHVATSERRIAAAEAEVRRVQTQIADSTLVAPVAGRVLYRLAAPGEIVAAGQPILTLLDLSDVYMEIFLPAADAGRLALGAEARIVDLVGRFGLAGHLDQAARALPLGVRQRLSLAVAVIHEPPLLILDEPTSGVDPEARDAFWQLLFDLSRDQGVTIFISTHFMTEAERCDRVALMHAGRVLACDAPSRLVTAAGAPDLEAAFVAALRAAEPADPVRLPRPAAGDAAPVAVRFSPARLTAYARREVLELVRDPVRLAFAFFGSAILMVVFCYGVSLDIRDLTFAVLDLDRSPESRAYAAAFDGSAWFAEGPPVADAEDAQRRLATGKASLTLEIPPGFGRDLDAGRRPEVLAVVDGAIPFKGETVEGYAQGVHAGYLADLARDAGRTAPGLARVEPRFRYNPTSESIYAMAPAIPAILLVMLPAILTAVSVTRERELGTIANFHATPTTRLEFLMGKQLPYIGIAFLNFVLLAAMTAFVFGVPLKGDALALAIGALLFVWGTTAFGLVISALTASQVTAVFATALISLIPTLQFSGLLQPVSTLDSGAQTIGRLWPASYFLHLNVGAFTKGLGWRDLLPDLLALAAFGPAFTAIAALALRKQER